MDIHLKQKILDVKDDFEREGVVILRDVFSKEWLNKVEIAVQKNKENMSEFGEALRGEGGSGVYFNDYMNWREIPELRSYVYDSPAPLIAKILTGSNDIIFYHEHILCKEPGTTKRTPWHHDQAYYPVEGEQCCSIWMPLDYVGERETIMFVKKSHKQGYYLPYKFASESPYEVIDEKLKEEQGYKPIPEDVTELGEVVQWEVHPGDCVVFHMKTIHGAHPNMSTRHRRVLSTRWVGDDAVCIKRPWVPSPPVVGDLKPGDKFQQDSLFPVIPC